MQQPIPGASKRFTVDVHRTALVRGVDDKPALELTCVNDEVKIALLPKQGQRRSPVALDDLAAALDALRGS